MSSGRRSTRLIVCAGIALAALSLRAADRPPPNRAEEPEQPFVLGDDSPPARGVAASLGVAAGPGAPLRQVAVLAAGDSLRLWDPQPATLPADARMPTGIATAFLTGATPAAALTVPGVLGAGEELKTWALGDRPPVPPLDWHVLGIRDDVPLPDEGGPSVEAAHERLALHDALVKALRTPPSSFEASAFSALSARDLVEAPQRYRGWVVRVDGRARAVRRVGAPASLEQAGLKHLYQVWMTTPVDGVPKVVCLLTPVPPPGLAPTAEGDLPGEGPSVAAVGYFFKRSRFSASEGLRGHPDRTVPLLIGHTGAVLSTAERARLGAAAVGLAGFDAGAALRAATLLRAGERADCWTIDDPTRVLPLNRELLRAVVDGRPLPNGLEESERDAREALAYYEAVIKSRERPARVFLDAALPNVTFAHLFNEPARYRGEVVRLEGRLRRVRRFDPMLMVSQAGVKDLYEAWLLLSPYDQTGVGNPACLVCAALPKGIPVAEQLKDDIDVAFVGYFFKRYRYKPADAQKASEFRDAPLLIGHLVPLRAAPRQEKPGWAGSLLPAFFAVIIGTLTLIFGLAWAFRRADQRVRTRLDAAAATFANMPEEADNTKASGAA